MLPLYGGSIFATVGGFLSTNLRVDISHIYPRVSVIAFGYQLPSFGIVSFSWFTVRIDNHFV